MKTNKGDYPNCRETVHMICDGDGEVIKIITFGEWVEKVQECCNRLAKLLPCPFTTA